MGGNGGPRVDHESRNEGTRDNIVERAAPTVGHIAGYEASEEADTIDNDDQVKGVSLDKLEPISAEGAKLLIVSVSRIHLDEVGTCVEVAKILTPEDEKHAWSH